MDSEKNSEQEEDKQKGLKNRKDEVADIKAKIDLTDIFDVSLQSQDLTCGLNAEVDLDDSVDKVVDKDEKTDTKVDDTKKDADSEILTGNDKESVTEDELIVSDKEKETIETKDQDESKLEEVGVEAKEITELTIDNQYLDDTTVQEETMGNNIEGNEKLEEKANTDDINQNQDENNELKTESVDTDDNGNVSKKEIETKDYELETGTVQESREIESTDVKGDDKEMENFEAGEDKALSTDDTELKGSAEIISETETSANEEDKVLEIRESDLQEMEIENESLSAKDNNVVLQEAEADNADNGSSIENGSPKVESLEDTNENASVINENVKVGDMNDENGEEGEDEMSETERNNKEKIQNFIKEVIKDLHGIVAETEECDLLISEICQEESARSELVHVEHDLKLEETHTINHTVTFSEVLETCAENVVDDTTKAEETNCAKEADLSDADNKEECTGEPTEKGNIETNNGEHNDIPKIIDDGVNIEKVADQKSETNLETAEKFDNPISTEISTQTVDNKVETVNVDNEKVDTCELPSSNHKRVGNSLDQSEETVEASVSEVKNKNDLKMVEEELKATQAALQMSQRALQDETSKHNRQVMSLKLQLYRSQMELKKQKVKSEKQLTEIMSHLMMLEGRLRQEQLRLKQETRDKNSLLETQKNEIVKLKDQNEQLLNAIKEICAKGGMNGYMRENRRKNGSHMDGFENGVKSHSKDKKSLATGKLGSMKDKFMAKNRSSLELNTFSLEKYLIKDQRLCSSQEDLHRIVDERRRSIPTIEERSTKQKYDTSPKNRPSSDSSVYKNGNQKKHVRYSQNFFSESGSPKYEMNKSSSDSSHLSESTNSSSGVYSLSDHDLSMHNDSITNGHHGSYDPLGDDDDDDRIFSFSSTHINTVIAEEDGPTMTHSGQMMSMGSMPLLVNLREEQLRTGKNRPHSLSSVDLASIQQQAQNSPQLEQRHSPKSLPLETQTPPTSPSYHNKNELTPFQTFKTMFRRKGSSKNKGHKKRSVSLSQTTNTEYSEALKKHFQKYDMS